MRLRNDTDYPLHAMTDPPQNIEPGESIDHDVENLGHIAGLTPIPDGEPEPADDGDQDEAPAAATADSKTRRAVKPADTTGGSEDNGAR